MIDTARLISLAAERNIALSTEAAARLDRYAALLVEWNERMNLTAITAPDEMLVKHFLDSLTLLPALGDAHTLVDVGTGAGFPGMVAALVRPDLEVTLLDSLNKRLTFLEAVSNELGVNTRRIHLRAEEAGRDPALRERFDAATARAVAALPVLCEYCLPLVRVGGRFIAMKGRRGEEELAAAQKAIPLLGGRVAADGVNTYALPLTASDREKIAGGTADTEETAARMIVCIDKITPTSTKYPRPTAQIAKRSL